MKVTARQDTLQPLLQAASAREKYQTDFQTSLDTAKQSIGTAKGSAVLNKSAAQVAQTPQEELAEYLRKTPAQHMRDAILKEMGLTEEDLAALPPEQRAALEETIAEKIKERLLAGTSNKPNPAMLSLLSMLSLAKGEASAEAPSGTATQLP